MLQCCYLYKIKNFPQPMKNYKQIKIQGFRYVKSTMTYFRLLLTKHVSHNVYRCFINKFNIRKLRINVFEMLIFGLLIYLQLSSQYVNKEGIYEEFAVSSELPQASKIGVKILKRGGNSVDAAIATCIAVGIVNAFSSGLGGGGFALIKQKGIDKEAYMVDFREKSGENFQLHDYIKDRSKTSIGGAAVGVPAEIKGLYHIHKNFGKLPWERLFDDCIELCNGFDVTSELEKRLFRHKDYILADLGLREIYSKNGSVLKKGDLVVRDNYKRTLEVISKNPEDFYHGEISKALLKSINSNGGNLTVKDFADVTAVERPVLIDSYKDYKIFTTSLPSSGVLIIEALKLLDKYNLTDIYKKSFSNSNYQHIHILVEILKFVMARRGELGDPKFLPKHEKLLAELVGKKNLMKIFDKLDVNKTLDLNEYNGSQNNVVDSGTTHINVVDNNGLVVSLTSTINLEWGAKFMDPVTGIIFNNQIDDYYFPNDHRKNLHVPNVGGPKKIPLSSASPVILEKENELIVLGAAGGIRIPTSLIEVVFWLSLGSNLREAIEKPRLHHQLNPNILYVEYSEDPMVVNYLRSLGHVVEVSKTNSIFTSVQGIMVKYSGLKKEILAVSDQRKGGKAAGL